MIHTSAEQNIDEKHIILMDEPMREQNVFRKTHIPVIVKLEPWGNFIRNLVTQPYATQFKEINYERFRLHCDKVS